MLCKQSYQYCHGYLSGNYGYNLPPHTQLIDTLHWNLPEFLQVALVNIALNQVWTGLLILLIVTFPRKAFRLSPVLSAVAGFTSGFFIPLSHIPWWSVTYCQIKTH